MLLPIENIALPTQISVEVVVARGGGGDREAGSAPLGSIPVSIGGASPGLEVGDEGLSGGDGGRA